MDNLEEVFENLGPNEDGYVTKSEILEWVPEGLQESLSNLLGSSTNINFDAFSDACRALMAARSDAAPSEEESSRSTNPQLQSSMSSINTQQHQVESDPNLATISSMSSLHASVESSRSRSTSPLPRLREHDDNDDDETKLSVDDDHHHPNKESIRAMFNQLDGDASGYLSHVEFSKVLPDATREQLEHVIAQLNPRTPGKITFEEFFEGFHVFTQQAGAESGVTSSSPFSSSISAPTSTRNSRAPTHDSSINPNGRIAVPRASIIMPPRGSFLDMRRNSQRPSIRGDIENKRSSITTLTSDQSLALLLDADNQENVFGTITARHEHSERVAELDSEYDDTTPRTLLDVGENSGGRRGMRASSTAAALGDRKQQQQQQQQQQSIVPRQQQQQYHRKEREEAKRHEGKNQQVVEADEYALLQTKYDTTLDHLQTINRKYKMLGRLGRKLEVENERLNDQLANLTGELEEKKDDIEALTEQLEHAKAIKDKLLERVDDLTEQNLEQNKDHHNTIESLELEQSNNQRLMEEIESHRKLLGEFEKQKQSDSRQARMKKLEQSKVLREALQKKRLAQQTNELLEREKKKSAEFQKKLFSMTLELSQKDEHIKSLDKKLKEAEEKMGDMFGSPGHHHHLSRESSINKKKLERLGLDMSRRRLQPKRALDRRKARRATLCLASTTDLFKGIKEEESAGEVLSGISDPGLPSLDEEEEKERKGAEEEEAKRKEEAERLKEEERQKEADRLAKEHAEEKAKQAEEARKQAEAEALEKEEAARKAEELRRVAVEEARKREEEARQAEEARKRAQEEARKKIFRSEEEAKKAEEARKKAEDDAKKRDEEAKRAEEARKQAEEEARKAQEARKNAEDEAKRREQEAKEAEKARLKAEVELQKRLEIISALEEFKKQIPTTCKGHLEAAVEKTPRVVEQAAAAEGDQTEREDCIALASEILKLLSPEARLLLERQQQEEEEKEEEEQQHGDEEGKEDEDKVDDLPQFPSKKSKKIARPKSFSNATSSSSPPEFLRATSSNTASSQQKQQQQHLPWPDVVVTEKDMSQISVLSGYVNQVLGSHKMLIRANLVPIDVESYVDLIHKVSNGLILAALINSGASDTIDMRAINHVHYHDPEKHPFLHLSSNSNSNSSSSSRSSKMMEAGSSAFAEAAAMAEGDMSQMDHGRGRAQSSPVGGLPSLDSLKNHQLSMHAMMENLTLVVESAKAIGVQTGALRTKHLLHSYGHPMEVTGFMWKILAAQAELRITLRNFPKLVPVAGCEGFGSSQGEIDWKEAYEVASSQYPRQLLSKWANHHLFHIQKAKGGQKQQTLPKFADTKGGVWSPERLGAIIYGALLQQQQDEKTEQGEEEEEEEGAATKTRASIEKFYDDVKCAEGGVKERWHLIKRRLKSSKAYRASTLVCEDLFDAAADAAEEEEREKKQRRAGKDTKTSRLSRNRKGSSATGIGGSAMSSSWFANARFVAVAQIFMEIPGFWPITLEETQGKEGPSSAPLAGGEKRLLAVASSSRKWGGKRVALMNDDKGESRLERAFRMWINSTNAKGVYIHNLFTDCRDGLVLLKVLDKIVPGSVPWRRVEKKPTNRFQKLGNCNLVVSIAKGPSFNFSLVSVGGDNLAGGNKKLILAVVWQMMRFHLVDFLQSVFDSKFGKSVAASTAAASPKAAEASLRRSSVNSNGSQGSSSGSGFFSAKFGKKKKKRARTVLEGGDEAIIEWANTTIAKARIAADQNPPGPEGYKWTQSNIAIRTFRDEHLATSLYLFALLWAVDPYPVDWAIVTPGKTKEDRLLNARYAISVARKLGATIFLLPEDITERNPKMVMTFVGAVLALTT